MKNIITSNEELMKIGKSFDELAKINGFGLLPKSIDSINSLKELSNSSSFNDLSKQRQ